MRPVDSKLWLDLEPRTALRDRCGFDVQGVEPGEREYL